METTIIRENIALAAEILRAFADWLPKFRTVISDEYLAYLKGV